MLADIAQRSPEPGGAPLPAAFLERDDRVWGHTGKDLGPAARPLDEHLIDAGRAAQAHVNAAVAGAQVTAIGAHPPPERRLARPDDADPCPTPKRLPDDARVTTCSQCRSPELITGALDPFGASV